MQRLKNIAISWPFFGKDHGKDHGKNHGKKIRYFCGLILNSWLAIVMVTLHLGFASSSRAQTPKNKKKNVAVIYKKAPVPKQNSEKQLDEIPSNASGVVITEILYRGQKRIESDAIAAKIKTVTGKPLSADLVREDIQALFKTGFFYDVQVYVDGQKLIYQVVEKPSVVEINFEGNVELKSDELLENSGLKVYEILNLGKLKEAVDKIQKMYEDKGYYLAKIETQISDVKKDETVKIQFKIVENDKVKVKQITVLGNHKLKEYELKSKMAVQEEGFFSLLSSSGSYKQEALERDTQVLRFLYLNEGYVKAQISRPQVYVTPDKKSIYITYSVEEGEQYDVGEIDFSGDLLFSKEELGQALQINKRKVFSYEVLQKDLSELSAKYGDLGYAFTNVVPKIVNQDKERKVDITFDFDKGHKVYFGRFNVVGNHRTRDKVVRRELKIFEGDLYNETRRRQSVENITRLGFFEDVSFKQSTPLNNPDLLNLDIVVKERNTGSINLGAGYGSYSLFSLQGQVTESNFLGRGQNLSASIRLSRDLSEYSLGFAEPYLFDTDWKFGADIFKSQNQRLDYREDRAGTAIRFGHPITENIVGSLRYKYEIIQLNPYTDVDASGNQYLVTDLELFPLSTARGESSSLTASLEYDKRNDRFSPSKGMYLSTSYEYAGIGGSLKYAKAINSAKYFKKLFWDVVWRNNFNYSAIDSTIGGGDPPFNELFLLGGPYTLRGYDFMRVGKTRLSGATFNRLRAIKPGATVPEFSEEKATILATKPVGGRRQLLYQMEIEFPLINEAQIKGVTFYDVGQAEDDIKPGNFYSDIGFGIRWFSPLGPLRFEWGFPMRYSDQSPNSNVFQFSIGSPF